MVALVTGGAGFIGSHVVDALLEEGYRVRVIDDLSTGREENLASDGRLEFHRKSILDENLGELLRDVEEVYHLAAQINVRYSVENPAYDLKVNALGTLRLLEQAEDLERFLYASSGGAVYGEPQKLPVSEEHPTDPISPYGASKLAGEKYVQLYRYNYGIKYAILRYANVYGERQDARGEAGVIAIFLERLLAGKPLVIYGTGEQTRDYVYVGDVVRATLLGRRCSSGVFNIGTGIETSVNTLVDIITEVTGREPEVEHAEPRKGEVFRIYLDITRARDQLGFSPEVDLHEGIARVWSWIRSRA
ncbi:MAG: NAD-dependent epimerase/dehydratase family protein [Euryarchaeota archaeon]|nr:NAD-dependent epimerase/dehydratase family protein [Euryarchaeota archaeon]